VWVLLPRSATALGVAFWVPTHAPKYLATYSESVSAFLSHPAPGYPGRDLPLGSYLSRRRLWGGRGTSRVRLPFTGTITMALKPPFPSLYHFPKISGPEAFPRRRSLHGLSYPMGIREPHRGYLAFTLFDLATPWLGDASTQATPCLGDASTQAMPCLGDALSSLGDASSWRLYIWATP